MDKIAPETVVLKDGSSAVITAILTNAFWMQGTQGRRFLVGDVHRDVFERWPDGRHIQTSYVLEEVNPEVFKTRSDHYYRVESWIE